MKTDPFGKSIPRVKEWLGISGVAIYGVLIHGIVSSTSSLLLGGIK